MAAGSSAPELATVVIGVFFAKDDIGISGVIGSAVFNIMFVISVCALCSGTVCQLNWWPLVRDCFFYCVSILVMLIIIFNDVISCVSPRNSIPTKLVPSNVGLLYSTKPSSCYCAMSSIAWLCISIPNWNAGLCLSIFPSNFQPKKNNHL